MGAREEFRLEFSAAGANDSYHEILDSERVSWRLGKREVFDIIQQTPNGLRRLKVIAQVEKYP